VIQTIIRTLLGDEDGKKIKKYQKDLNKIRHLEASYSDMTLVDIQHRSEEIRASFTEIDFTT
jgi:preprotein translocase subunit SecA